MLEGRILAEAANLIDDGQPKIRRNTKRRHGIQDRRMGMQDNCQWFLVFRVRRLVTREAVTVVTLPNDLLSGNGPSVTVVTLKTAIDDYIMGGI